MYFLRGAGLDPTQIYAGIVFPEGLRPCPILRAIQIYPEIVFPEGLRPGPHTNMHVRHETAGH